MKTIQTMIHVIQRNHVRHIDLKKYNEQELLEKASKHNQQYKKQQAKLQQIYQEYDQNQFLVFR